MTVTAVNLCDEIVDMPADLSAFAVRPKRMFSMNFKCDEFFSGSVSECAGGFKVAGNPEQVAVIGPSHPAEVTPEMEEAGFRVLAASGIADDYLGADRLLVAEIYRAMLAARRPAVPAP